MEKEKLRKDIEEIIKDAFKRIKYAYNHHCEGQTNDDTDPYEGEIKTRLVFPNYADKKTIRISEQELRFAFVEAFNDSPVVKEQKLFYSIETPTEKSYSGFSSGEPKQDDDGRSGEFDLVILKKEKNDLKRICLIEFKAHNADEKDYWKDLLKLNEEKQDQKGHEVFCYFINVFKSYKKETIKSIRSKYHRFFIENRKPEYVLDNVIIWWYALESPNKKNGEVMNNLFMMDNLHLEDTGINGVIYVTHKWPKHNPFVIAWISENNKVSISIEDNPKVLKPGNLPDDKSNIIIQWIRLNKQVLLDYWNNEEYPTSKMLKELRRL